MARERIVVWNNEPCPASGYVISTTLGRFSASRYELTIGIISSRMPLTTSVGCEIVRRSAKRSPVTRSQSRNAAICALATSGPETPSRSWFRSANRSTNAPPAAWPLGVSVKKIFCRTLYPLFDGSCRCFASLGFSRCMMSSPPRGAVPTRISRRKMAGRSSTICWATMPPSENPSTSHVSTPRPSGKWRHALPCHQRSSALRPRTGRRQRCRTEPALVLRRGRRSARDPSCRVCP